MPASPDQMARRTPQHPGPEIGHRAQEQEPGVVGHQMQPVVLQRPANPRVTRLALQRRRRTTPASHPLAAPQRAMTDSVSPTFGDRPKVMMRPHHSTGPRVLLGRTPHRASVRKLHPVPADAAPVQGPYRNSSRKSTPKRIRLSGASAEQKSALVEGDITLDIDRRIRTRRHHQPKGIRTSRGATYRSVTGAPVKAPTPSKTVLQVTRTRKLVASSASTACWRIRREARAV